MSQFESPNTAIAAIRSTLQMVLSRLNKISTADGKIRSDGAGSTQTGVPKLHSHLGSGEGGNLLTTLNFLTASGGAPHVNDDESIGYQVGSQWIDTVRKAHYVCVDATAGAAVWKVSTTVDVVSFSLPIRRRLRVRRELPRKAVRPRRRFFYS